MKKLFLFVVLSLFVLSFNACSSDDDEQKPPSDSLRSCDLWIVKNNDYNSIMHIESGNYDRSTQTLNLKAKDGTSLTFELKFEDTNEDSKKIQSMTYNGVLYVPEALTIYFRYWESKSEYNLDLRTTVYSNNGTLQFNGSMSFYK